ncbi:MAG: hypothetical protein HFI68_07675 [Lachnospiraceae bacterium]|nr:hypothetical protein [Lachnospiraceae bacterium]
MKKRIWKEALKTAAGVVLCLSLMIQPLNVAAVSNHSAEATSEAPQAGEPGAGESRETSAGASAVKPDTTESNMESQDSTEQETSGADMTESESTGQDPAGSDVTETDTEGTAPIESEEVESVSQESEGVSEEEESLTESAALYGARTPHVNYTTHVQTYGWLNAVSDGKMSGTEGQSKRLEAIKIYLSDTPVPGGIEYQTHVQSRGWMNWVANGNLSGTEGLSKRLEAIKIRLTGEMAEKYDVYYRVHSQSFGWLGWAKNGEPSGTMGYAKRLEAIEIRLVEKGQPAPGSTSGTYREDTRVTYQTHVQTYGWLPETSNGKLNGTEGQSKRLEAIKIRLENHSLVEGSIEYRVHCQSYGWMPWVKEGGLAGTENQFKRLEAIEIRLTGEMAKKYDIYYRVHCQSFGWTGWASNGNPAGTEGYAKRLEAIEITFVNKGGKAPGATNNTYYRYATERWGVDVSAYQETVNWSRAKADGVEFAMLRITQKNTSSTGGTVMEDRYFQKNAQGALANGIPIGGYVYCYASTPAEAAAEAEFAVKCLRNYRVTYPIAFDLEVDKHMTTAAKLNNMAMANAYCSVLQKAGYKTVVYGSPSKLRNYFDYGQMASSYGIWLARYRWDVSKDDPEYKNFSLDFSDKETRTMVKNTGYEGGNWTGLTDVRMWQYTEMGRVDGIPGKVDLDLDYTLY